MREGHHGGSYLPPRDRKVSTAIQDEGVMRRQCRKGDAAYADALRRAGHLPEQKEGR
jgi:hypothetical protein